MEDRLKQHYENLKTTPKKLKEDPGPPPHHSKELIGPEGRKGPEIRVGPEITPHDDGRRYPLGEP